MSPALAYLRGVHAAAVQLAGRKISPYRVLEMACAGTHPEEHSAKDIAAAFWVHFAGYRPDEVTFQNIERCFDHYDDRARHPTQSVQTH